MEERRLHTPETRARGTGKVLSSAEIEAFPIPLNCKILSSNTRITFNYGEGEK
jgi:hypothetical protein